MNGFYPEQYKTAPIIKRKVPTAEMAKWKGGFDGTLFTREECAKFIDSIPKEKLAWVKDDPTLVVHNTGAPSMAQEDATPDRNKDGTGEDDRIRNTAPHYKGQGWSGGPSFFVFNSGKIGVGTPLPHSGVHCAGWSENSIGVEMVADFDGTDTPESVGGKVITDTTAWLFAYLLKRLGYPLNEKNVRLHKEGKTTHDCPGKLFKKEAFLKQIKGYMDGKPLAESPLQNVPMSVVTLWVNTPGDTLNFRSAPAGSVKGRLPHGTMVKVVDVDGNWRKVKTPAGYEGWVDYRYLAPAAPASVASTPAVLPPPPVKVEGEVVYQPGSYKYSDFCRDWAKRFEGFRTKAYWDVSGWAVGYGHNSVSGIPPIPHEGFTITMEDALKALDKDLDLQLHYLEAYVDVPLTQGWVDALVLHIFQQGPGNFREGPVRPLVNAGKFKEAAARIKQGIGKNANLLRRRAVESEIALGGKPTKW